MNDGMSLIISCMDYRIQDAIDSVINDNEKFVIMRNGGANVKGLTNSIVRIIKQGNVKRIKLMPHSDCAAMKIVYSTLRENKGCDAVIYENLVEQFNGENFNSLKELEIVNKARQYDSTKNLLEENDIGKGIQIESSFVNTETLRYHQKNGSFVLSFPISAKYHSLFNRIDKIRGSYFLHSLDIEDLAADLVIANKLVGLNKLFLLYVNGGEKEALNEHIERMKKRNILGDDIEVEMLRNGP
ncbi:MAG: hypothetical protein JRM78_01925 [Nitrososphaerota archaeon]|nr:hypothetical protein [Nitrososphaerota archaeon]MDG7048333.1 hypothetical protein [Nitrososphaerota archaeon]